MRQRKHRCEFNTYHKKLQCKRYDTKYNVWWLCKKHNKLFGGEKEASVEEMIDRKMIEVMRGRI